MMTDSKFLRLLGLCAGAGKVVSGEEAVRIAVKKRRAHLIVLDSQSAQETQNKVRSLAQAAGIELVLMDADIGKTVGHEGRKVAAVLDAGFAKALLKAHESV